VSCVQSDRARSLCANGTCPRAESGAFLTTSPLIGQAGSPPSGIDRGGTQEKGNAMSRTIPCPHCAKPIVETARLCCFCARPVEVTSPQETVLRVVLSEGSTRVERDNPVGAGGGDGGEIFPFPVPSRRCSAPAGEIRSEDATGAVVEVAVGHDGAPPVRQNPPWPRPLLPIRFVVLLVTVLMSLAVFGKLYPSLEPWLQVARGLTALGGMTWILMGPYTGLSPLYLVALSFLLRPPQPYHSAAHPVLSGIETVILFLNLQVLIIAVLRAPYRKRQALMAVTRLDESEEDAHRHAPRATAD
jgi:hypothetical protein